MADAIFEALRASMSEPGCGYIDFTWRPTDKDGDPRGAEDARALADDLAARMPAFDADHPDCGDRCACYQRGINDEWEATGD